MTIQPISETLLKQVVERILKKESPQKIVLFGSVARNQAKPTSDLDLLIVMKSSEPRHKRSARFYSALSDILVPMDILVYTEEEIKDWENVRQAFVTTALREGRVLYEKPN